MKTNTDKAVKATKNKKREPREFRYGNYAVKYDLDALEKAVEGLGYEQDEEGNTVAYATGLMDNGAECHIRIVKEWGDAHGDDMDWDSGDDLLTISSDEVLGHCGEDTPDSFIITSIGGYEADVQEFKPKFKTFRVWLRAGVSWNVTPDELELLINGSSRKVGKALTDALKSGKAYLDGDSYMPEDMYESEEDVEKLTEEQLNELNSGNLSWEFTPPKTVNE
jgi:hypothetical protein